MNAIFELLHNCCCPAYNPDMVPEYLRGDPIRACSQYAFEKGFRLGMQIAFTCIEPDMLCKLE